MSKSMDKSQASTKTSARKRAKYHHGALKDALLNAAEGILRREGIENLTLRAAAREAGVSHAAPKNHFDNLTGLLSDLAARGFERFNAEIVATLESDDGSADPQQQLREQGRCYVTFARDNPDLFQLMFRNTKLDYTRPALKAASDVAFSGLTKGTGSPAGPLDMKSAVGVTFAWSLVHGFAMLMIDGRLDSITSRLDEPTDELALLDVLLGFAPNGAPKQKGPE